MNVCSVDGCEKTNTHGGKMCVGHKSRVRKTGSPGSPEIWDRISAQCSVDGCERKSSALGMCRPHYHRARRYGDPLYFPVRIKSPTVKLKPPVERFSNVGKTCAAEGCERNATAKGYCGKHYDRVKRFGTPEPTELRAKSVFRIDPNAICIVDGCERSQRTREMCRMHYTRAMRMESPSKYRGYTRKRRASRMEALVYEYGDKALADRMAYWGNKCWMCGGPFDHVDHVKPLSKGGLDCPANFRPACRSCNVSKGAKWYGVAGLRRFVKA